MQRKSWILGATALSLVIGGSALTQVSAQGGARPAAGSGRRPMTPAARLQRTIERETGWVEQAIGKKLTAAQKTQLKAAITERENARRASMERYMGKVSAITKVSQDQLRQKMRSNRGGGEGRGGGRRG